MNNCITNIVFDYGCVISLKQNEKRIDKICGVLRITKDQYRAVYQKTRNAYDAGLVSAAEYWHTILAGLGEVRRIPDSDLRKIVKNDCAGWLDINSDTIKLIKGLHKLDYRLAILSNMTIDTLVYLKKAAWIKYFSVRVFSCEEKTSKPDEKIYRSILSRLGEEPEKSLFIDDSRDNISAAKKVGLNTILYENHRQLINELKESYAIPLQAKIES
jgi:HAD superfamily hydrolase (TIGR01509 family)